MTQIITLTVNPAIDVSTSAGRIAPFTKLRCAPARRNPGGGGINVTRVVSKLGRDAAAIYPAGGATGQLLRQLLERGGLQSLAIPTSEVTREDFTVFEERQNSSTVSSCPVFRSATRNGRNLILQLRGNANHIVVADRCPSRDDPLGECHEAGRTFSSLIP